MATTNLGLSVSDVVSVSVSLQPQAAQQRNFGSLLIMGDSNVIDTNQRLRLYSSLAAVGLDFGGTAPEFLAAQIFFGQATQPAQAYIGRWARTATNGVLAGGVLSATQQLISNFSSISSGGLNITVDGTPHNLTAINLTSVTNLNAVASALQAALSGAATVFWDSDNSVFRVSSASSGPTSSVTFATAPGSGTDISSLMGLIAAGGGYTVTGISAESALAAVIALAAQSNAWYGLMFASSVMPSDPDDVAVAGFINGVTPARICGISTQEPGVLSSAVSNDVASQLQALGYNRTYTQYSGSSPYSAAAAFGDAFTVNFNGQNTLYTLKFQQEAGVAPETLTETQAAAADAKNCNYFVNYNNNTAILQQGKMSGGQFFDVIHGTDWLQNFIQTAVFNVLLTAGTKVPQTDAGVNRLVVAIAACCEQAVTNGLVAPGVWNGPTIGPIVSGSTLSKGYAIFAPPVSTQSQAARAARQAPVITACIKLAGAIHSASVVLNVNQ